MKTSYRTVCLLVAAALGVALVAGCSNTSASAERSVLDAGVADASVTDSSLPDAADANAELEGGDAKSEGGSQEDVPESGPGDGGADVGMEDQDAAPGYDPRVKPELCGMAPYTWLASNAMGDILEVDQMFGSLGDLAATSKLALQLIKSQMGSDVNLHRDPQYDTLVYRIRYQTQDKGIKTDATGIVALPMSSQTKPLLLFQHGTEGLGDACAPSAGTGLTGAVAIAALMASFGYVVAVPDYLGLKSMGSPSTELHSYLIGEPTAIASLDMLRAVPKFLQRPEVKIFGLDIKVGDVIITGGSQGGHASAFTTRFAPYYAPELSIKGAVWGIPPTDMVRHAVRALTNYVPASGNTALVLLSSDDWYRDDPTLLSQVFAPPFDTTLRPYYLSNCDLSEPLDDGNVDSLDDVFTAALLASAENASLEGFEPWGCYIKENTLSRSSVPRIDSIPAFMILSEGDELVNPDIERTAFGELCAMGYKIQYRECIGASHSQGFVWSLDDQLDWLDARYQDMPLTDVCQVHPPVKCTSTP